MTASDRPNDPETSDAPADTRENSTGSTGREAEPDPVGRAWDNIRTLAERSLDEGVVLAYGLLFAASSAAAALVMLVVGGVMYATVASDLDGGLSSVESLASVGTLAAFGGCFLVGMVVWQTVLVGFQRPMHRLLTEGRSAVSGARDALRQAIARFGSILGVSAAIGLVVWGGAATSFSVGLVSMTGGWEGGFSMELLWPLLLLGGGWLIVATVVCFLFGPATYFAATRDFGVFDALATSYRFVLDHLVGMIAAWALFLGLNAVVNTALGTIGSIPCCGAVVGVPLQLAVGFFSALAGLIYWVGVYVTFERAGDSLG